MMSIPPPHQLLMLALPRRSFLLLLRTRKTIYKRKRVEERDRQTLQAAATEHGPQSKPGDSCYICGLPKVLPDHAYYRGQFYCPLEQGPGAKTAGEWLEEQGKEGDMKLPKTIAWRMSKKGTLPLWKKIRQYKLRICQLCGQPNVKFLATASLAQSIFVQCKVAFQWKGG